MFSENFRFPLDKSKKSGYNEIVKRTYVLFSFAIIFCIVQRGEENDGSTVAGDLGEGRWARRGDDLRRLGGKLGGNVAV